MITKETATEEIERLLIEVTKTINEINYNHNPRLYNELEIKKRNLEDIFLIRKQNIKTMEELTWKIDLNAKCPHCEKENSYIFYLNAEYLLCQKCNREFNIQLWVKDIEVRCNK